MPYPVQAGFLVPRFTPFSLAPVQAKVTGPRFQATITKAPEQTSELPTGEATERSPQGFSLNLHWQLTSEHSPPEKFLALPEKTQNQLFDKLISCIGQEDPPEADQELKVDGDYGTRNIKYYMTFETPRQDRNPVRIRFRFPDWQAVWEVTLHRQQTGLDRYF